VDTESDVERIWGLLQGHRGAARAVTAAEIARYTGIGDAAGTDVRAVLAANLEVLPEPVAANENGYFVVETVGEAENYERTLRSRALFIFARRRAFRNALKARGWWLENGRWKKWEEAKRQGELFAATFRGPQ